jgi:glycine C-acetyltransferase
MDEMLNIELNELRDKGLFRSLRKLSSSQGRMITIDGKEVLNFCSNDYLGLASDLRLQEAAARALVQYGVGSGASRLVCGNSFEHEALEKEIALLKHTEAALVFNSGYAANTGIIPALVGRDDVVFSDKLNHASIVDGIILSRADLKRYPHCDMAALADLLEKTKTSGRKLIVTDTVFSMDGDIAPLKEITALARRYGAWLMVDEAHAFGVFGARGAGLVEAMGLEGQVDVQMGTLSKAAGVSGAYVAGSNTLRDYLVNHARSFIYTTAQPSALAVAAGEALRIIRDEPSRRERLKKNADHLRKEIRAFGFDTLNSQSPIIPLVLGEADKALLWSKEFFKRGIFVSAIRPPTVPEHTARLRITVTSEHTSGDLSRLLDVLFEVKEMCS